MGENSLLHSNNVYKIVEVGCGEGTMSNRLKKNKE